MRTPPNAGPLRRGAEEPRPIAGGLNLPHQHVELIDQSHQRCLALGVSRIERPDHTPIGRPDLAIARERNLRLHPRMPDLESVLAPRG